jgi:hypothetical protein
VCSYAVLKNEKNEFKRRSGFCVRIAEQPSHSHLFNSWYVSTSPECSSAGKTDFIYIGPNESIGCQGSYFTYRLSTYGSHRTIFTCSHFLSKFPSAAHGSRYHYALGVFIVYIPHCLPMFDVQGTRLSVVTPVLCSEGSGFKPSDRFYCVRFSWLT